MEKTEKFYFINEKGFPYQNQVHILVIEEIRAIIYITFVYIVRKLRRDYEVIFAD
jgi:hypothetical protein